MKHVYGKNIIMTIRGSLGRYIAIMAIVALGVGFFVGVKVTKDSMLKTCNKYVIEHNMYDYKLISTLGFDEDELETIGKCEGVSGAEGSISWDFFSTNSKGSSVIYRAHSMTEEINTLSLVKGRLPEKRNECVGDKDHFSEADLGRMIEISSENDEEDIEAFEDESFVLVGLVDSVYYINMSERGTSSLGDGSIDAYIYLPREEFTSEYYMEVFVTSKSQGYVYSDEYDDNIAAIEDALTEVGEACGMDRYDSIIAEAEEKIDEGQAEIDQAWADLGKGRDDLDAKRTSTYAELDLAKATLDAKKSELDVAEPNLIASKDQLTAERGALELSLGDAINSGDQELVDELEASITEIDAAIAEIEANIAALPAARIALEDGYDEYYKGLADADDKFASAESDIDDSEIKILDAEQELAEARLDLADLKEPELYVQKRDDNLGYVSFDSNSDIVDSIAKVFPIFFFLIAALVCSTTMSRMVEEERLQIGALVAMGYSRIKVMIKYLIYSGSAALIGCIIGFALGSKFFPYAIWIAYGMIFGFAPLEYYFSLPLALLSLAVALICSLGTTWVACRRLLKHMPAEVLRPSAPKAGKRVLIEKITPLWSRLSFLHKVTVRNVFRYKKRMFMMIVGIAGCAALVLAGFGIYDSVAGLANHQYDEIEVYDVTAQFDKELRSNEIEKFKDEYGSSIAAFVPYEKIGINVKSKNKARSCSLMITSDADNMKKLVKFRGTAKDAPELPYPGEGEALINNKLAELMGLDVGDTIKIEYDDTKSVELTVSGIYKNYVDNYVYISESCYEKGFHKIYEPTMAFIDFDNSMSDEEIRALASEINGYDSLLGMKLNLDTRVYVDKMMKSLDYIVWLVIACAGALAFIVLFNLSNINITEREREIATIKVLGFYKEETGAYVFRENIVLVVMGIILGLPLGVVLHKFIMAQIIVDAIAFNSVLRTQSYFYAAGMVILFTLVVDIIMRRKLRKINMAEALKSVE